MYRFILSRRWIGFAIFVILLASLCVRLGLWQWHRLHDRLAENKIITAHLKEKPVPLDSVLEPGEKISDDQVWTRVKITGKYDLDHEVTVKFTTRNGAPGVDVVTPLVAPTGDAILVDRGWIASGNNVVKPSDVPQPATGHVTVIGWLRQNNGAGGQAVRPVDEQVRAISSTGMKSYVPYRLFHGYLNLRSENPKSDRELEAEPVPERGQGPHLFYSLQWWFFAALAVFGWFYFAYVEARDRKKAGDDSPRRD